MKTLKKTIDIYLASDGKEFLTEKECAFYEENTLKRYSNIKHFLILHGADFTEGRGFFSKSYFAVESNYSHLEFAKMYAQIKYGNQIDWMYTYPALVWDVREISKQDYQNGTPKFGNKIFVSYSDIDGYPKSIKLDNKTKKEDL